MTIDKVPVITIDGPSGSGKGTISRWLATRLGWQVLDSGSLYRLVALLAIRRSIAIDNESGLAEAALQLDIAFNPSDDGELQVNLEGEDVSTALRDENCGKVASQIAAISAVREALLQRQRAFRQAPGLIADGRDMGTVVFPDAELKFYLTASVEERAQRRYKQLNQKGISATLATLLADIEARDRRDQSREVSPLKPAEDAHILDTSDMSVQEVCDTVFARAQMLLG